KSGTATLSSASAQTDASGFASINLQVNSIATNLQIAVCAVPATNPCQIFTATVVPIAALQVQPIGGTLQVVAAGQALQPVIMRLMDSSTPANPVLGANVMFQELIGRTPAGQLIILAGEAGISS